MVSTNFRALRNNGKRFEKDCAERARADQPEVPLDQRLLEGLQHGLPECAGVALGLDRLLMKLIGVQALSEVLAFPIERA